MDTILLYLHIAAGSISLVLFWLPLITAKGRRAHRRIGTLYVYVMSLVVGSAFILSVLRIAGGAPVEGLALLFLSTLTTVPLVSGVQILKTKHPSAGYRRLRLFLAGALMLVSASLLVGYFRLESTLLLVFGLIGVFAASGDIRQYLPEKSAGKSWLKEHYEAMLFSGAAAYTAFFAFGGRTLLGDFLTGWLTIIPWILPTLLTFALLPLVHRHYRQGKNAPY